MIDGEHAGIRRDESARAAPARRGWRLLALAFTALALVVAGGVAGAVTALHYGRPAAVVSSGPPASSGAPAPAGELARAAAIALPSVVTIEVAAGGAVSEGSGVVLSSDGTIITNNHVIEPAAGGAGAITVTFRGGRTARAAIVGRDPGADIAVIRAVGVTDATPAVLGNPSRLRVGDTVLAVGSPLGLSGSVTSGIVSALHRTISVSNGDNPYLGEASRGGTIDNVIQTDTAINPGNSGGALVDSAGRVVGITTAIASVGGGYIGQGSGSIGVGFAIPIETAYRIARILMGR